MGVFIEDGYEEKFYIGIDGEAIRGTYRPMLFSEREAFFEATAKLSSEAKNQRAATELAKRVTSWDVLKQDGSQVDIAGQNILKLKPAFFVRLFSIVSGSAASDDDPEAPSDTPPESHLLREAADAKN